MSLEPYYCFAQLTTVSRTLSGPKTMALKVITRCSIYFGITLKFKRTKKKITIKNRDGNCPRKRGIPRKSKFASSEISFCLLGIFFRLYAPHLSLKKDCAKIGKIRTQRHTIYTGQRTRVKESGSSYQTYSEEKPRSSMEVTTLNRLGDHSVKALSSILTLFSVHAASFFYRALQYILV